MLFIVDIFLPLPDGLLANLQNSRSLIDQLLQQLPTYHQDECMRDDSSALGAALQAALKLAVCGLFITVMFMMLNDLKMKICYLLNLNSKVVLSMFYRHPLEVG